MVLAPGRAARPGAFAPLAEAASESDCPFCEGREAETPPEVFAIAPAERRPDGPGWRVRVVPNRFPALAGDLGRQEVVVHTPRHVCSLADLTPAELADVALAWRVRASEARAAGFAYVHAFVNEGRAAGASRQHGHSQLAWLPEEPHFLAQERANAVSTGRCPLCVLMAEERSLGARVVAEEAGVLVLASYAGRAPYELLVAPLECQRDAFASDELSLALRALACAIRRLHAVEGRVPLNAWVHTFPWGGGHWHVELLPRITVFAGLELGAELYVNPLPPEDAAERLRV